jgi:glycosyltransferase involved in cell wall biosynthesis
MQAMQLKERFKLNNIAVMPYDSGLPHTRKTTNDTNDCVKLFMSLYGTQLGRIDLQAIFMLDEIVSTNPKVCVTIACCKGLAKHTTQELKRIAKKHPDRWTFLPDKSWDDHAVLMGQHDLTVWPAKFDGMGIVGITSLAMGTPVIAWDVMPVNEYLTAGRNALLIGCGVEYTWLGVPVVKPDYVEFERVLRWLIDRPDALSELRKHTKERISHQTDDFKEGWEAILPPSL